MFWPSARNWTLLSHTSSSNTCSYHNNSLFSLYIQAFWLYLICLDAESDLWWAHFSITLFLPLVHLNWSSTYLTRFEPCDDAYDFPCFSLYYIYFVVPSSEGLISDIFELYYSSFYLNYFFGNYHCGQLLCFSCLSCNVWRADYVG